MKQDKKLGGNGNGSNSCGFKIFKSAAQIFRSNAITTFEKNINLTDETLISNIISSKTPWYLDIDLLVKDTAATFLPLKQQLLSSISLDIAITDLYNKYYFD